jgi:pimeloyl-ACP methyl ester carboxylesterase
MPTQPRRASARESSGDVPHAVPHESHRGVKSCPARNARTSARSAGAPSGSRGSGRSSAAAALELTAGPYIVAAMAAVDREGVALHYEVHGEGDATPLLLSHGFGSSSAMWGPNLGSLARGRRVATWDLRGHGDSDAPDDPAAYSHDASVADMAAVLDAAGMPRAVLVGMSLGGYLSQRFRLAHPERVAALVLVDTGPGYRRDDERAGWNAFCERTAADLEARGLAAQRAGSEVALARHRHGAQGLAHAARGIMAQDDAAVIEALEAIDVPTLVVVGSEDEQFLRAASYMAARIPGARQVVIDGAGHAANVDNPADFDRDVTEFLEEL